MSKMNGKEVFVYIDCNILETLNTPTTTLFCVRNNKTQEPHIISINYRILEALK